MNFLPIVARELYVTARRRSTYWLRLLVAGAGLVLWFGMVLSVQRSRPLFQLGQDLFTALSALALAICLLSGVFLTADCLSEEKRTGTLRLLFLTDLKGVDVVLGKLVATSVHAFYGVLVLAPVLAMSILFGGVTAGELGRVVLVLLASLLLSLGMGILISALLREAIQTMMTTFLALVFLAGVCPWIHWLERLLTGHAASRLWLLPSPGYAYWMAFDARYRVPLVRMEFWQSCLLLLFLAGLLLGAACWLLPGRCEGEPSGAFKQSGQAISPSTTLVKRGRCHELSRRRLEKNPFLWLCQREYRTRLLGMAILGAFAVLWLGSLLCSVGARKNNTDFFILCLFTGWGLHVVFKILIALQATRRLFEDRQSGNWELLLVTPLPRAVIPAGQWAVLRQWFLWPGLGLGLVNMAFLFVIFAFSDLLQIHGEDRSIFALQFCGGLVVLRMDYWALVWSGMAAALRARTFPRAAGAALGRVMAIPWLGLCFIVFLLKGRNLGPMQAWSVFALWYVLAIVNDLWVGTRARGRFQRMLQEPAQEGALRSPIAQ